MVALAVTVGVGGPVSVWAADQKDRARIASAREAIVARMGHGDALRDAGDLRAAEEELREGLRVIDQSGLREPMCAELLGKLGVVLALQGSHAEGRDHIERGLGVIGDVSGPRRARLLTSLSWILKALGDPRAREIARESLALTEEHLAPTDIHRIDSMRENASHYEVQGAVWRAEQLLNEAAEQLVPSGPSPSLAEVWAELGYMHLRRGKYHSAVRELTDAYRMLGRFHGRLHPTVLTIWLGVAQAQIGAGQFDVAQTTLDDIEREAMDAQGRLLDEALSIDHLRALLAQRRGDGEAHVRHELAFLANLQERRPEAHDQHALSMSNVAIQLDRLGRRDDAWSWYERVRVVPGFVDLPPFPRAMTHLATGDHAVDAGDHEMAERELLQALRIAQYAFPAADETPRIREAVQRLYRAMGRPEEARRYERADVKLPPAPNGEN